jgi:hypothetical protein
MPAEEDQLTASVKVQLNQDHASEEGENKLAGSSEAAASIAEVKQAKYGRICRLRLSRDMKASRAAKAASKEACTLGVEVEQEPAVAKDDHTALKLEMSVTKDAGGTSSKTGNAIKADLEKKTDAGVYLQRPSVNIAKEILFSDVEKPNECKQKVVLPLEEPFNASSKRLDTSFKIGMAVSKSLSSPSTAVHGECQEYEVSSAPNFFLIFTYFIHVLSHVHPNSSYCCKG